MLPSSNFNATPPLSDEISPLSALLADAVCMQPANNIIILAVSA